MSCALNHSTGYACGCLNRLPQEADLRSPSSPQPIIVLGSGNCLRVGWTGLGCSASCSPLQHEFVISLDLSEHGVISFANLIAQIDLIPCTAFDGLETY